MLQLSEGDREALRRFNTWAAPVMDSIRLNNDGARRPDVPNELASPPR